MSVCLHCGEMASEGALFCIKCGYTLPQVDASAGNNTGPLARPPTTPGPPLGTLPTGTSPTSTAPQPPPSSSGSLPWAYPPGGYVTLAPPPGALGAIPAPPAGKYCIRCRTVISRVAVYCPVCQQPQS
ncbi:MAG: zinc-ribbon domain-containing protein [Thermoplasmata archaeon]